MILHRLYKNITSALTERERKLAGVFVVSNTLVSLLDILCIIYLLFVLKFYTDPNAGFKNNPVLQIIFADKRSLLPAIWLLLLFSAKNLLGHGVYQYQVKFIARITNRLSRENLTHYLHGDYRNFTNEDSAVFIRRIIHQPTEFSQYVLFNFQLIITESVMVALAVTALLVYNAKLLLIAGVALLPPVCLMLFITKQRLSIIKQHIKTTAERSLQYLREALSGFVESNIFDKNAFFIQRHTITHAALGKKISGMQITQDLPSRLFEVFAVLGLFLLIVGIKLSGTQDNAYLVLLGAFMAAAYKIIPGISKIINLSSQLRAYQHTMEEIAPKNTMMPSHTTKGKITAITLRDLSFSYNGKLILHQLNGRIHEGMLCGISGDSGKGKTTLLNLVAGFLQPESGSVLFNGTIPPVDFRNEVAYVKQDPFILHASILDNIVLFEEQYNAGALQEVLDVTGLSFFLKGFPEGIEKMIMEGGKNISGGQRQRIALARALYKNASALLLDEPFSELDKDSEMAMLQHLKTLAASGKIILLISHNPASLQFCDTIIQLNANQSHTVA